MPTPSRFFVVGHRGAAARAPENTASSFRCAMQDGAHAIELDVQLTSDQRALVHHDESLSRLCDKETLVREQTLDHCRQLTVSSRFYRQHGIRVPRFEERLLSLDEALELLRPSHDVDIELKGTHDQASALAIEVVRSVTMTGGEQGILVTSANPRMLAEVHRLDPKIRLGLVYGSRATLSLTSLLKQVSIHWIIPNQLRCHPQSVSLWRELGLKILPYTVNEPREFRRLKRLGVDGIITDDPGQYLFRPSRPPRDKKLSLVLDLGSTRSKVALIDEQQSLAHLLSRPCPTQKGAHGDIGVNLNRLVADVESMISELDSIHGPQIREILITSQRSTFAAWNRRGKILGDAPSWRCTRGRSICAALQEHASLIQERSGLPLSPAYSASKIALKQDQVRQEFLCGPLPTYLIWKWSQGKRFVSDPTLAARTQLMNLDAIQWDPVLLELFGIEKARLPDLLPTRSSWGQIEVAGVCLPLRVVVGDQQAAYAGLASSEPSQGAVNFGTGAFVFVEQPHRSTRSKLPTSLAWTKGDSRSYLTEGTIHRVGPALKAFRQQVPTSMGLNEALVRGQFGSSQVLPSVEGLGSPYWRTQSESRVEGSHRVQDVACGLAEAFGFMIRDNLEAAQQRSALPQELRVGGGLSHSPLLMQRICDAVGIPFVVEPNEEVTLLGAIALSQGRHCEPPRARFSPQTSEPQRRTAHRAWHRVFGLSLVP